MSLGEVDTLNL